MKSPLMDDKRYMSGLLSVCPAEEDEENGSYKKRKDRDVGSKNPLR